MLSGNDYMDDNDGYYELVCVAKIDSDSSLMAVYVNKQTYEYCVCPASEFEKKFKPVPQLPQFGSKKNVPLMLLLYINLKD